MDLEIKAYKSLKLEKFWVLVEYLEEKEITENKFIENCKKLYDETKKGLEMIINKY